MRATIFASVVSMLMVAGTARDGWAQVSFDFESPTYTAGNLIGQNGWIQNTYYPTMNGTVAVSTTSPLSGSQSVAYTQTTLGTIADVGKADVMLATAGVPGTDLTLSYIIRGTTGLAAPFGGIFLGNGAPGGASPIFARLNGSVVEVGSNFAAVPLNSFFFLEGERLKMTYEIDFDNATMNFIVENLDVPDTFSQSFPFFAPYGNPTGPNGEYNVGLGVFLRSGNVQIDDITLTQGVGPITTQYDWAATGSGNWNQVSNWAPLGIPGTLAGRQKATLGVSITANATIYNKQSAL